MLKEIEVDKSRFFDSMGKPITQALFLEFGYKERLAVYSLKDYDHEYKGNIYPSLKLRYLEMEDPTEYEFANKYLANWSHWKRICENNLFKPHIEEWREELEIKIRSQAVRDMIRLTATEGGNFSATKWLADRGWEKRAPGRPSNSEKERTLRILERANEEFDADVVRLKDFR